MAVSTEESDGFAHRTFVLAPIEVGATRLCEALRAAAVDAECCDDIVQLCRAIQEGAGCGVVASEALSGVARERLSEALACQPEWSDFPLVVVVQKGAEVDAAWSLLDGIHGATHINLIERPIHAATLVSVVRSALQARRRQYQLRDHLTERQRLVDSVPILLSFIDRNECYRFANWRYFDWFGARPEELVGQAVRETIGEQAYEVASPYIRRALSGEEVEYENVIQTPDGSRRYGLVRMVPSRNETDEVIGFHVSVTDVTQLVMAEEELRQSEERFRQLADSMPQIVWTAGPDGAIDYYNERVQEFDGFSYDESTRRWQWEPVLHPDDRQRTVDVWSRAVRLGRVYQIEHRVRAKSGMYRWFLSRAVPVRDDAGAIVKWFGTGTDINATKRAEQVARKSERRLRLALQVGSITVFGQDRDLRYTWIYNLHPGFDEQRVLGRTDRDIYSPADAEAMVELKREVIESGQSRRRDLRITIGGEEYIQDTFIEPEMDEAGQVKGIIGAAIDVTERKRHEEQMRMIMGELNHRVKNTLSAVQGMAMQTLRTSNSLEKFSTSLQERLQAMATAHSLLTRTNWEGAKLGDVVRSELEPRISAPNQAGVHGPAIMLPPRETLALHMVIHELCTNAVKHGALSTPDGRVDVQWRLDRGNNEQIILRLDWEESGGPAVSPPSEHGFGSRMMVRAVEYELEGEANLDFRPEGLVYRLSFPCSARTLMALDSTARQGV